MITLSHELVLQEAARLLHRSEGDGLNTRDLEIDSDILYCKALPRSVGGITLSDAMMKELSPNDFSRTLLVPWLARMSRLKALYLDLRMLGVMND